MNEQYRFQFETVNFETVIAFYSHGSHWICLVRCGPIESPICIA